MSTCRRALHSSHRASSGRKHGLTLPVTKPQKPLKSTASICLVTGCIVVSTLLLQYLSYYCSMHYITAVSALLPQCPPRYGSTGFSVCKCHHFLLQAAPLLLKYNPCECSTGLIAALLALLLLLLICIQLLRVCDREWPVTSMPNWVAKDFCITVQALEVDSKSPP